MQLIKELTRDEMKNIMAGDDGNCRVFVNGSWSTGDCLTVEDAQLFYDGFSEVTGYCCDSCGDEGFENAESCPSSEPEVA